ncbi:1-acyl-sn-glycerol-3-phosphate acyltransferase [Ketobacter sp. MCCC 1A13808]|uniref:lysophospholipid acyltransferase family protein n=1 Tax=Ketobacter sp. MCCC 1A13808 TaxID=2602738 RepID=UPI0012EC2F7E|nr:lysophospholipid acyltransferase family protein [Ketobacter sp. MCCC 1A13808]MVF14254.1 1-acyl-sn-glycerol-3-phosphate acyltransferase [Ketobacter sp. MCCC 1A13808]
MNSLRGLIFNICYVLSVILLSVPFMLMAPFLNIFHRAKLFVFWSSVVQKLLEWICGVRVKIIGVENIPQQPVVVVSNHQSTWETLALYRMLFPLSTVLKKELTYIPLFGWLLLMAKPIVIDRKKKATAMKEILRQGKQRLEEGLSVLIFPEGTRVPPHETKDHLPGGALLAVKAGCQVLPIVHNAGLHWPAHKLAKVPGEIIVKIGKPVSAAGRSAKELNHSLEQWLNREKSELLQPDIPPD